MSILLVRHAESQANIDWSILRHIADTDLALTEKGVRQAEALGVFIADFFKANPPKNKIRLWSSPYRRTIQTTAGLLKSARDLPWDDNPNGGIVFYDDMLREREYGLLEGFLESEREEHFPHQSGHYNKLKKNQNTYYARPYGGESPADVSGRLRHFYGSLMRSIDEGIEDHVIVAHGNVNACFSIGFTRSHPMFFETIEIGHNTSVLLFDRYDKTDKYADYGLIYDPSQNIYCLNKPKHPVMRDLAPALER